VSDNGTPPPRFRVRCPACGPVQVDADELRLLRPSSPDRASYTFRCPGCARLVRRSAGARIVELLGRAGVVTTALRALPTPPVSERAASERTEPVRPAEVG
jgi:hypothetical protein